MDPTSFRNIAQTNVTLMLILVVGYIFSYLFNILLARLLPSQYYGDVVVLIQVLTISVPLILLGASLSSVKVISDYLFKGDWALLKGYLLWLVKRFLVVTVLCYLLLAIFVVTAFLLGINFADWHPLIHGLWIIPVFSLVVLESCVLQGFKQYSLSTIHTILFYGILTVILGTIYFLNVRTTINSTLAYIALACLIIALIQLLLIFRQLPSHLGLVIANYTEKKQWQKLSLSMLPSTFLILLLTSIDIIMLEILAKNHSEVGYFAAILAVANVFLLVNGAIQQMLGPMICDAVSEEDQKGLQKLVNKTNLLKFILSTALIVFAVIFVDQILALFGQEYLKVQYAYVVVVFAFYLNCLFGSYQVLLVYSNNQAYFAFICLFKLIFTVFLDLRLIPLFGINGAAAALLIVAVVTNIASLVVVRLKLKTRLLTVL